jgi:hypothetical protein
MPDMENLVEKRTNVTQDDDRKTLIYAVFAISVSILLIAGLFWMFTL